MVKFVLWNKENFGIPLFGKFPIFDPNKEKILLFAFPYLDYTLYDYYVG